MKHKETILITGGAGSLGKAFCRLLYKNYRVIVIDNSEWSIAELTKEIPEVETYLMDFVNWKFAEIPCDYLLHLAAYKNIQLGEDNVLAFVDNNVTKSLRLLQEAFKNNVQLMFMSTDKAVEPTSVYGFGKAIVERASESYNFAIARCGNILSSSGSVIPTWEKAIESKLPIPITDERMIRFFIEDRDAATQIWDKFHAGDKLIIPQCEEIRILDLLTKVLFKHGYKKASDYEPGIYFTGMRPGEKIREKLEWGK